MWNKVFSFSRVNELVACRHVGALNLSSVPYIRWYRGPQILKVTRKDSFRNLLASNLAIFEVICRAKIQFFIFQTFVNTRPECLKQKNRVPQFEEEKIESGGLVVWQCNSIFGAIIRKLRIILSCSWHLCSTIAKTLSWLLVDTARIRWTWADISIFTLHFQHHFGSVKSVRLMPL